MTAKEKQAAFIKHYLKPALKSHEYLTSAQTWWKDKGEFFNIINLQNYSWNSSEKVDFRFNVGIALKGLLRDQIRQRPTHHDLAVYLDEGAFLPDRVNRRFGNNQGYSIETQTDMDAFAAAVVYDFEKYVLPKLEEPKSLQDCLQIYGNIPFWGERLKILVKGM
jgi:hypothetical protein